MLKITNKEFVSNFVFPTKLLKRLKTAGFVEKQLMNFASSRTLMLVQLFGQNKFFKHRQI